MQYGNFWSALLEHFLKHDYKGEGMVFTQGGPNNRKNQILTIFKKFTT